MPSQSDIANRALDLIDEATLHDFNEGTPTANWFKRNYDASLDELLTKHRWNFAMRRQILPMLTAAPAWGWEFQYQLPNDCLLFVGLEDEIEIDREWVVEGGNILSSRKAPLAINYIGRVPSDRLPAFFVAAFVAKLASQISYSLTHKNSFSENMARLAEIGFREAVRIDGLESAPPDSLSPYGSIVGAR